MEKYAGIDIAKRTHWMCVTDAEGRCLMEPRLYANDAEGLSRMVADLDLCGGDVAVGMESTGCYWRSCYKVLAEGGYPVSVINPVVTCAERKSGNLGRAKTDRVDCLVVADALRKQGIAPTPSPDADAAQLRDLCRFRRAVSESMSRAKIQAVALLDQVWPEYGKLFSDKFGDSSRAVLRRLASGDMDSDALADDLRGASRNRFGAAKASAVLDSLRSTCGVPATDALRLQLRLLLDQLDFCAAQLAEIDAEADALLDAVAPTLPTVPGIGRATAAQIAAEVGDVTRFRDAKSLVAYAGLDPTRRQSGGFDPDRNRISKRGSAHLRRSLYIASQASLRADCEFRDFYDRLRARGVLAPLRRLRRGAEDALRVLGAHALGRGVQPGQAPGKGKGPRGGLSGRCGLGLVDEPASRLRADDVVSHGLKGVGERFQLVGVVDDRKPLVHIVEGVPHGPGVVVLRPLAPKLCGVGFLVDLLLVVPVDDGGQRGFAEVLQALPGGEVFDGRCDVKHGMLLSFVERGPLPRS